MNEVFASTPAQIEKAKVAVAAWAPTAMRFLVIIPLLKNKLYLHFCLSSILSQQGDFVLRVHIQTADKSGDVQRVVRQWQKWLEILPKAGRGK